MASVYVAVEVMVGTLAAWGTSIGDVYPWRSEHDVNSLSVGFRDVTKNLQRQSTSKEGWVLPSCASQHAVSRWWSVVRLNQSLHRMRAAVMRFQSPEGELHEIDMMTKATYHMLTDISIIIDIQSVSHDAGIISSFFSVLTCKV